MANNTDAVLNTFMQKIEEKAIDTSRKLKVRSPRSMPWSMA